MQFSEVTDELMLQEVSNFVKSLEMVTMKSKNDALLLPEPELAFERSRKILRRKCYRRHFLSFNLAGSRYKMSLTSRNIVLSYSISDSFFPLVL